MIISRQKNGTDLRSFVEFTLEQSEGLRMTDGGALKAIVRNCILVVYRFAYGVI